MPFAQLLKRGLRRLSRRAGVELTWYTLPSILRELDLDIVLDVGANEGQYAQGLRNAGYGGRIVSFEPLSEAHESLVRRSRADSQWTIAPRIALGEREQEMEINVSANSYSSSLLPMAHLHEQAAPGSAFVRKEKVQVRTLDSIVDEYLAPSDRAMLKLDVQGYETKVLEGARECLDRFVALQLEASLTPLYAGETLIAQMIERVKCDGLDLWSLTPGFVDHRTGRLLQVDCLFLRKQAQA